MAHRNGLPKTNATERTQRRFRLRHNKATIQDKMHKSWLEKLKEKIFNDRVEMEKMKNG